MERRHPHRRLRKDGYRVALAPSGASGNRAKHETEPHEPLADARLGGDVAEQEDATVAPHTAMTPPLFGFSYSGIRHRMSLTIAFGWKPRMDSPNTVPGKPERPNPDSYFEAGTPPTVTARIFETDPGGERRGRPKRRERTSFDPDSDFKLHHFPLPRVHAPRALASRPRRLAPTTRLAASCSSKRRQRRYAA